MIPQKNRIVQCFGVLDEADILEHFLAYHLSIGVDAFVAVDVGSTDGTLDILSRHERAGYLQLFRTNDPNWEWSVPLIATARTRFGAEWCLFGDVDEFWMFPDGDARAYLASAPAGIIIFRRYNVLPSQDVTHFSNFNLVVNNPLQFFYHQPTNVLENFLVRREDRNYAAMLLSNYPPEILREIAPKVVARPELVKSLTPGFHDVVSIPADAPRHEEQMGYIAHFPMRSVEQFRRKAAHVSRIFDQIEHDPDCAYHWARLNVLFRHDLIEQEFVRQLLSENEIERLLSAGILRRDPSLPRALVGLSGLSATPPRSNSSGESESSLKSLITRIAQRFVARAATPYRGPSAGNRQHSEHPTGHNPWNVG
jgi:Glycosyl transferase family 2